MKSILKNRRNMFFYKACNYKTVHIIITLIQTAFATLDMICTEKWSNLTEFYSSFLLPTLLIGTLFKFAIYKYFVRCRFKYADLHLYEPTQCCGLVLKQFTARINRPLVVENTRHNAFSSYRIESNLRIADRYRRNLSICEYIGAFILQLLFFILYAFICISLGAPIFELHEQTMFLAVVLTLFSVVSLTLIFGWTKLFQLILYSDTINDLSAMEICALKLFASDALGCLLGAWCGTIVQPLDWNCDWQQYPIPNVIGAIYGVLVGNIYTGAFYDPHYVLDLKKKK